MNLFSWTKEKTFTNRRGEDKTRKLPNFGAIAFQTVTAIVLTITIFGTIYTVEEGHVGVVKHFSEAKMQVSPGLHFKIPLVETVEEIEVRARKNVEKLSAATAEQMPVTTEVSVNWTVEVTQALDLYKRYGGLQQFENRILDPRLRSASKTAISKYTAEALIKDRQVAIADIATRLTKAMEGFPVTLDSVQIENIALPPAYLKSIEAKQTAKNLADAEQFKLDRQNLEAQRDVNIKKATAQGIELVSIQKAAAIEREGIAEAQAIKAKAAALKSNPLIVQLTHEQQWNGSLLTTSFGGANVLVETDILKK